MSHLCTLFAAILLKSNIFVRFFAPLRFLLRPVVSSQQLVVRCVDTHGQGLAFAQGLPPEGSAPKGYGEESVALWHIALARGYLLFLQAAQAAFPCLPSLAKGLRRASCLLTADYLITTTFPSAVALPSLSLDSGELWRMSRLSLIIYLMTTTFP